jgi:DNA damage-binding protein 2
MVLMSEFSVGVALERARISRGSTGRHLRIRLREERTNEGRQAPPKPRVTCKVCKEEGHAAGFRGNVYFDCPNKPCFLCFNSAHSTMDCPHRAKLSRSGCSSLPSTYLLRQRSASWKNITALVPHLRSRECLGKRLSEGALPPPPMAEAAAITGEGNENGYWSLSELVPRMQGGRIGSMCFFGDLRCTRSIVSGDKKGELAIWTYGKSSPTPPHMLARPHEGMVCSIVTSGDGGQCYSVGVEGIFAETSEFSSRPLLSLAKDALGLHSLTSTFVNLYAIGDGCGNVYFVDPRTSSPTSVFKAHKGKVNGLDGHPQGPLLASSGGDRMVRLWDLRALRDVECLGTIAHRRSITSVKFSPTGQKLMTTSADNRIRAWQGLPWTGLGKPDSKIVHSHNLNRYLTPLRAVFDPKDPLERRIICGRYMSEELEGRSLHPIDVMDLHTGALLAELAHPSMPLISPVLAVHPAEDCIISAGSRTVCVWRFDKDASRGVNSGDDIQSSLTPSARARSMPTIDYEGEHDRDDDDVDYTLQLDKMRARRTRRKRIRTCSAGVTVSPYFPSSNSTTFASSTAATVSPYFGSKLWGATRKDSVDSVQCNLFAAEKEESHHCK